MRFLAKSLCILFVVTGLVGASLRVPCSMDEIGRYCSKDYKCCAYVNDSIYDNGNEIYFCMNDDDYNYNILDDGSYSENNGLTKYYYLECEQTFHREESAISGLTSISSSLLVLIASAYLFQI